MRQGPARSVKPIVREQGPYRLLLHHQAAVRGTLLWPAMSTDSWDERTCESCPFGCLRSPILFYATHTGTRDITERMDDMLTRHGFRVAVMKADAVAPERREAWVADRVKQGIDVMICHPRLVQTGLDLIDFPTLCWYETEFSVFQSTEKGAVLVGGRSECGRAQIDINRLERRRTEPCLLSIDRRMYPPTTLRVQSFSGGPKLTVD